jgi:hypothetical protein
VLDFFKLFGVGTIAGLVNGFFGAGGGLLLVPMIEKTRGVSPKVSHATTLGCVMFMCISSSIIYFVKKQFDFNVILACAIGSVFGSLIGTKLLKNLKNNIIDLVFAIVLVISGIFMIIF